MQKRWARALPFWAMMVEALPERRRWLLFGDTGSFEFQSKNSVSSQRLSGINDDLKIDDKSRVSACRVKLRDDPVSKPQLKYFSVESE